MPFFRRKFARRLLTIGAILLPQSLAAFAVSSACLRHGSFQACASSTIRHYNIARPRPATFRERSALSQIHAMSADEASGHSRGRRPPPASWVLTSGEAAIRELLREGNVERPLSQGQSFFFKWLKCKVDQWVEYDATFKMQMSVGRQRWVLRKVIRPHPPLTPYPPLAERWACSAGPKAPLHSPCRASPTTTAT